MSGCVVITLFLKGYLGTFKPETKNSKLTGIKMNKVFLVIEGLRRKTQQIIKRSNNQLNCKRTEDVFYYLL